MKRAFPLFLLILPSLSLGLGAPDLSKGVSAFQERRWSDAMDAFLDVLRQDPANSQAHAYVVLITREMEAKRQAMVRELRLNMLGAASKTLGANQPTAAPLQAAIVDAAQSENNAEEQKRQSRCEEARMEREAGHLLAANDLILEVLAEKESFPEAQRELSELQSQIRRVLDSGTSDSIMERYALEGFYAYGQADYAAASTAWGKARALVEQSYPGPEGARRLSDLRFTPYEKIAQAHVDEEKHLAELKTLFENGVLLFQENHFTRSLEEFRKLAILDPEYPQLGYYLVQAEAASEHERAERLGQEKQREIERALQSGLAALEKEHLLEAARSFEQVLRWDPTHPQARSYLVMVRAEMQKRHDPKAAQMHYEAGLIAYASGKLDEAVREWNTAARMNPQHEKAQNALAKVQKELALNNKEVTDETLP